MDKETTATIADYTFEANIYLAPEDRFRCPARDGVPDLVERLGHEMTDEEYTWFTECWDRVEYDIDNFVFCK